MVDGKSVSSKAIIEKIKAKRQKRFDIYNGESDRGDNRK
jgi:hypothetical protein